MKTNSIAAAYPLTKNINAFGLSKWIEMPKFTGEPPIYRQDVERKVAFYHTYGKPHTRKLRKGFREWDTEALSKAEYLPLGLI